MSEVGTIEATLRTVARALGKEQHLLAERPDLTWQQLHNRLQWADPPLERLTIERACRSRPGSPPWIHQRTPGHESDALLRTFTGHTDKVTACAISPDGSWIVSASDDKTLKIWDPASGTERATFATGQRNTSVCAGSADGMWILAGAGERMHIWDATTGTDRACLTEFPESEYPGVSLHGAAISPDGSWIVSASADNTLKVWDAATGTVRAELECPFATHGLAVHPLRPVVASRDDRGKVHMLRLVGLEYRALIVTAVDLGDGLEIRCPHCNRMIPWDAVYRDQEMPCPLTDPDCDGPLKVHLFIVREEK